jgi:hypothetical protein
LVEPVLPKLRDFMTQTRLGSKFVVAAQVRAGEVLPNGNVEFGSVLEKLGYPEGSSRLG